MADATANALGALVALLFTWTVGFRQALQVGGWLYFTACAVFFLAFRREDAPSGSVRETQAAAASASPG